MKKKLYFKLKRIFEGIYITTTFLAGYGIAIQLDNKLEINKGLLLIFIISAMLTACKIYFTDKMARERGE